MKRLSITLSLAVALSLCVCSTAIAASPADAALSQAESISCTVSAGLSAPAPRAEATGDGEVTLTWEPVEGAERYAVAEAFSSGTYATFTKSLTGTSYTATDLPNGYDHDFLVQAYVNGRWSSFGPASLVRCRPEGTVKPAPAATAGDGSVELSWGRVPGATKYAVAYRNGSGYRTLTTSCSGESFKASGLSNGTSYRFLVQACVYGRWTSFSDSDLVSATPFDPSAPAPRAEATGDGEVTLTWEPVEGAERYAVAEAFSSGTYATFTKSLTGTSYTATDLPNGYDHDFLVQAYVNGRWSSFGPASLVRCRPEGTVKPAPAATAGDGSVELSWGRVPGANQYVVSCSNGKSYRLKSHQTSVEIKGLKNGEEYTFYVRAKIYDRLTALEDTDYITCMPYSLISPKVSVSAVGDGTVDLKWNPVAGALRYAIAYKTNKGYKTVTYDCLNTEFTINGLTNGQKYSFIVQANIDGRWSPFGSKDLVTAIPEDPNAPKPHLEKATATSCVLSWNQIPGAERYAVALKTGNSYKTYSLDVKEPSYLVSGLNPGSTYRFLVQAFVNGRWSSSSDAYLCEAVLEDVRSPQNVKATCPGDGKIQLTWDFVPNATRYAIAEYKNGSYVTFTTNCLSTSYTVSDLTNGRNHRFLVQSYVDGAWSAYGDALLVDAVPHGVITPRVTGKAGDHCANLSWSKVSGATRYAIAVKTNSGYKTYTYNCTGNSYRVEGLNGGQTYQFVVQAYLDGVWSPFDEDDLVSVKPTGTNDTVFGIPRLTVVNWLTSHQYNGYYLGTRYSSGFSYQTCLYPNGAPGPGGYTGMNCTGFVAHVFRSLGVNVDAVAANNNHTPWGAGPGGGGYINAWRWYGYAIDSGCKVYHFNTVADMLNSGLAKKGDVIFFKTDGSIDCHIGFFWGDNSHDNKMWHQILPGNLIGPCFNNANKSEVRQQCVLIK